MCGAQAPNEAERLALLHRLELIGTPPEPAFDRITRLAAHTLQVPIALISLVDHQRQWLKSSAGLDVREIPRDQAFCAHAIHGKDTLVVRDALADPRFANSSLVAGRPYIRFYAGIPLLSADGLALGTLCVIDRIPRHWTEKEQRILADLADIARQEILNRETISAERALTAASLRAGETNEIRFRATFEQASVGIALLETDGRWRQVNDKLCSIIGYSQQELLALTFQDITHPDDLDTDLALATQVLAGEIDHYTLEKRYIRKDKAIVWINLSVSLTRDANGQPQQFISVVEDINARKQAEFSLERLRCELEQRVQQRTEELHNANQLLSQAVAELRQSQASLAQQESQLRAVLENAQDAYISIDQEGRIRQWNRQAEATFGWTRAEAIGLRLDETIIPTEFREAHQQGMQRLLQGGTTRLFNKRLELSALRKNGIRFPVEVCISPLPSESGHLFSAFLHDISERKRNEEALRTSQQQLRTIANNLPVQIAYVDASETVRFINDTYRADTGLTPELALGKKLDELLTKSFYDGIRPHLRQVLSGERATFETTTRFHHRERIWHTVYIPDFDANGIAGFYIMSQDITARKQLEHSLHDRATRDSLTGLPNRSALLEQLQSAVQRCDGSATGNTLALFFLDLDGFKAVNDRHGHEAGDAVLKQFAARLMNSVRKTDLVARLAGDEFVVLLEGLDRDSMVAEVIAGKILEAMRQPFSIGKISVMLGTSIGLYIHEPGSTMVPESMLVCADQAMYEAKRRGRNQFHQFDSAA